jgi:hypothetical protein
VLAAGDGFKIFLGSGIQSVKCRPRMEFENELHGQASASCCANAVCVCER